MGEENFFINKIRNRAEKEGISFTETEEKVLLSPVPTPGFDLNTLPKNIKEFYEDRKKLVNLNNKVISLLRDAIREDLKDAPEVKAIKLGWFKQFKMPVDWHEAYMSIYDSSNKILSGILQNFVIGNPFE